MLFAAMDRLVAIFSHYNFTQTVSFLNIDLKFTISVNGNDISIKQRLCSSPSRMKYCL